MQNVDVIIVGGGPAGISTALFLAHAAPELVERIVVLEKERYPREKYCAGGLGARADKLLASIGVVVDVPSVWFDGVAFRAMGRTTVVRDGAIGRVVRRIEFDHAFARIAMQRGIRVLEDAAVSAIRPFDGGVEVESRVGRFRAPALVGADGVTSIVRRALGFGSTRYRAQVLEIDTEPLGGDLPRDVLLFDITNRELPGYYWEFPTLVEGRERVCRGVYLLKTGHNDPHIEIQDVLAGQLAARGLCLSSFRKKRFAEQGFEPHRPVSRPHILLAGEAAGIDPVTGEGIAQAIQYGAVAGRYLACRHRDRCFGFEDWSAEVRRATVGRDLLVHEKGVRLFYGAARPVVERFLLDTPDFIRIGMQHFAGKRWSRVAMARAGWGALRYTAGRMWDQARELAAAPIARDPGT